jgi:hypothetical protein
MKRDPMVFRQNVPYEKAIFASWMQRDHPGIWEDLKDSCFLAVLIPAESEKVATLSAFCYALNSNGAKFKSSQGNVVRNRWPKQFFVFSWPTDDDEMAGKKASWEEEKTKWEEEPD